MTRTRILAAALTATAMLTLGACGSDGSDGSESSDPQTSEPTTSPAPTTPPAAPTTAAPTTPEPSASTSTPTNEAPAPAPTGKLIDYTTDDEGLRIVTASDVDRLTGAPADFKTFIAAELKRNSQPQQGCTEPAQISVEALDSGRWARGGYFVPQCGGYATLWAKSGGVWKDVWSGQSLVDCSTLTTYKIPARIAGGQCLKGEDAVPYSG